MSLSEPVRESASSPPADVVQTNRSPIANSSQISNPHDSIVYLLHPTAFRRLVESIILFLGIILFLRAVAVEPFGVPTGSMAPTLSGDHRHFHCPECGFPIHIGKSLREGSFATAINEVDCPNCSAHALNFQNAPLVSGDRLLVDKSTYHLRSPRRWEMSVFWCPVDDSKPYVKRVVGLPGESILIRDGDLFVNEQMLRKTIDQSLESSILLCDMNYLPRPGWSHRWDKLTNEQNDPTTGLILDGSDLRLIGTPEQTQPIWFEFVHRTFDDHAQEFLERSITDQFVYNSREGHPQSVHDFLIRFDLKILDDQGRARIQIQDGRDTMELLIPLDQQLSPWLLRRIATNEQMELKPIPVREGKSIRIECGIIDRQFLLRVNGRAMGNWEMEPTFVRNDVSRPMRLGIERGSILIQNFRLSRDVHYRAVGDHAVGIACQLGPDEYFMLGDNSGNSDDSRTWKIPGVSRRNIFGKPFLLHQPSKQSSIDLGEKQWNFQTVDWSRIRWLR